MKEPHLIELLKILKSKKFIDLTHPFEPGIPSWKGFPNEIRKPVYYFEEREDCLGSGFFTEIFTHVGQWGTHVDPPIHFHKNMRSVDQINLKEMVLPLVLFDVHEKVEKNPDYVITREDVRTWETKHGKVPEGSFAALRTDWSKRWPDLTALQNKDSLGVSHYPGWSMEVLKYLYEERNITASGHETTDTDPGISTSKNDYTLEKYVLGQNKYQIELLTNLDKVPEYGGIIFATFPKPKGGSGFPARIFAVIE